MTQKELITKYVKLISESLDNGTVITKMKVESKDIPRGFKDNKDNVCNKLAAGVKKEIGLCFFMHDDIDYNEFGDMLIETHIPLSLFSDYYLIQNFFDDYVLENIDKIGSDYRKSKRLKLVIPLITNGPVDCKYKSSLLKMLKEDLEIDEMKLTYNLASNVKRDTKTWFIEL